VKTMESSPMMGMEREREETLCSAFHSMANIGDDDFRIGV